MRLITFANLKLKKISLKKNFINWTIIGILALGVIFGGYFLGKKLPEFKLAQLIKIGQKPQEVSQSPEEILRQQGLELVPSQEKIYEMEAQPGEGITHLARRALKEYLKEKGEGLNLTKEHKIYIEDYLQNKTGDYGLKVGQKITFSEGIIKEAIEQAQKLTSEQLQNLTQYSQLVSDL